MPLLNSLPDNASLEDLRSAHAELLEKLRPYAQQLMRGPSELTPAERELIAAFVSGLNACSYCHGTHARVAAEFGIDESLLAALLHDVETAPVASRLKPVMRYVAKLTRTPARLVTADAEAVRAAGFSDAGLFHAVAVCAYFNQMNRLVDGTGISGRPASVSNAARRLVADGYVSGASDAEGAERAG